MVVTNAEFIQGFIRLTDDAFKKGWHERNGGNLSYRIKPEEIEGYNDISDTQFFTAVQIAAGKVDVGLCTANVAKENGLDFIPLAKEVYYLAAADAKFLETEKTKNFLQFLRSYDWSEHKEQLEGYDFTGTGKVFKVSDVFTAE